MRTRMWLIVLVIGAIALATACAGGKEPLAAPTPTPEAKTLREQADRTGFLVGTTIRDMRDKATWEPYALTLVQEFNYVTIFTNMDGVETERGKFRFDVRDAQVAFAKEHGLKMKGHPLVWDKLGGLEVPLGQNKNADTPAWLKFNQPDCGGWSPAELDQIMKEWIQTFVSHYKGSITAWDVVNEPLKDSRPPGAVRPIAERDLIPGPYTPSDLKNRCWTRILGEDYIAKAFKYAHEADPDALLILNEYFGVGTDRVKLDKFLELVPKLKAQGVPIDAAGYQMHLDATARFRDPAGNIQIGIPPAYLEDFRNFLKNARDIGIQVHVTEMDVYIPPGPDLPQKLKEIYKGVLSTCLQFANCTALTTWGITDKYGLIRDAHSDAAPLLFDDHYQPKPAYYGVMEALKRE